MRSVWASVALVGLFAACREVPASIKIKTPRSGPRGGSADLGLPVFEKKGATLQLEISAFDDQERYMGVAQVDWSVTDRTVATVNRTGLLTILSSGEAEVVAKTTEFDPTREARLPIEVVIPKTVRILKPEVPDGQRLELPMGEFLQFEAEVINDRGDVIDGAEIEWTSTTYSALIDPSGKLEGTAIGSTDVVAEYGNAEPDRVELFVGDWPPGQRRRRR